MSDIFTAGGMRAMTARELAYLLIGIGAGIAWYRNFIIYVIGKVPRTMCDYCEFEIQKKQIFKRR